MKNTVKVLAAVLMLAAGSSALISTAGAVNTTMTMRQCKMHHSEHYCLMTVHIPNSSADHSSTPSKPAQ